MPDEALFTPEGDDYYEPSAWGLWGPPASTPSLGELELERRERPASAGARVRAAAGAALEWASPNLVRDAADFLAQRQGGDFWLGSPDPRLQVRREETRQLSVEELNARYGIDGALSFTEPASAAWASNRYERTRRMLFRQDVIEHAPGHWSTDLLAALGVGLIDPVNLFIPFARINALRTAMPSLARWEASASVWPRIAARAGFGAIEGAAFSAAVEPLFFGLAQIGELGLGDRAAFEYGLRESLFNLAAGAGVGSVLGGVTGVFVRGLPREVAAAGPEARAFAAVHALSAVGEARPVDAAAVFAAAERGEAALAPSFGANAIAHAPVRATEVFTPTGAREPALYAIVELDDLITSHTDTLGVEPRYPAALQPRDRSRAASETQVAALAANLEPARLGESVQADTGAPVVGSDGVVESGNARTIAVRRLAEAGAEGYETYKRWLAAQGYPIEGFTRPFLVRLTDAGRDPAQRARFAADANKPAVAAMSAAETAFADAARLDLDTLALHQGGETGAAGNVDFTRAALARLTSEAERGGLLDAEGRLSQAGERRLEAALMAKAYGDPGLVAMRFEALDDELKTLGGALADAAPAMARLALRLEAGEVSAQFDLRAPLQAAVAVLREARRRGQSVKIYLAELSAQGDMFGAGLSPRTLDVLGLLVDNGTRVRARAKIAQALNVYAKAAEASPAPVMFDEARIDYGRAYQAAARAAGEPGLRARDEPGVEGGGGRQEPGGAGAAERARDGRDQLEAELERQLEPRYGADAKPMARVLANGVANLAAHYGETAPEAAAAIGLRIVDAGASGPGAEAGARRLGQGPVPASLRQRRGKNGETVYEFSAGGAPAVLRVGRDGTVRLEAKRGGEASAAQVEGAAAVLARHAERRRPPRLEINAPDARAAKLWGRALEAFKDDYEVGRQGQRFALRRLTGSEQRARAAAWRAADKAVGRAERQAVAFLAAAACVAREGLGGVGKRELAAGLGLGAVAAIPAGWAVSLANKENMDPTAYSAEWLRRARMHGEQAQAAIEARGLSDEAEAGPPETWAPLFDEADWGDNPGVPGWPFRHAWGQSGPLEPPSANQDGEVEPDPADELAAASARLHALLAASAEGDGE